MAYKGPMAAFRPTEEEIRSLGSPEIFEKITGHKWSEKKHVREEHILLYIKYVDTYGEFLQKSAKFYEWMGEQI